MRTLNRPVKNAIVSLLFIILFVFIYLYRNNDSVSKKDYYYDSGLIFGTNYNITYESDRPLTAEIQEELKKFDYSLSTFNKESVISRVNQNDSTVVLDDWFVHVFTKAMEVSKKTDGAFDITVAPLVNAWGFGFKKKEQVTPELIDSILQYVGYEKLKLINGKIIKDNPNIMIDCAAIAKGYACDIIGELLASKGCTNYLVDIGGENVTKGVNPKGNLWRVGINKPIESGELDRNEIEAVISISGKGMATSGNYRNYYYEGGKRYAHTINPKSGYPIQHSLLSATVIAPDCMTADAYATAFMVMGMDKAMEIVEADPTLEAFFTYTDGSDQYRKKYSKGLEGLLE